MLSRWWQRSTKEQPPGGAITRMSRPTGRRRARGCRPSLEVLEDRITPASRLFAVPVGGNTIVELNPTTGAQINSFAAPEIPGTAEVGLAFDGSRLFFINGGGSDRLYELNPNTGAVVDSDLLVGGTGSYDGLAVVAGEVYVQDYSSNQILVFDPASDSVTRILNVAADLVGGLAGASAPGALIGLVGGGEQ